MMTFEEVTELLIKEYEGRLDKELFLDIPFEDKRNFLRLQNAVSQFSTFKEDVLLTLNDNSLVNYIKKDEKGFQLSTKFGDTKLLTPSSLFNDSLPFVPVIGDCYNNALLNTIIMGYDLNPAASVGIFYARDDNHIIHAIAEFDFDKERYIIDYNYNLVMNKDLYCNLFNFKILNTIKKQEMHEIYNLYFKCKEHTKNRDDNDNIHSTAYLELAPEEYKNYLNDIINDKRLDDYTFMSQKVYKKNKDY